MTQKEIHGKLKEKFGEVIGEWVEPEAGQPWIEVDPGAWREVAAWLKDEPALDFDFLRLISGVDYTERLEVVYHLFSYRHEHEAVIKLKVPAEQPSAPSVMDVWPAADWLERETYDMLGIGFEGHAELKRILLPEDWEGYPLRKDYRQPDEYHGITNW